MTKFLIKVRLVEVYADDWQGLYANGKLILQGHSLRPSEILEWLAGYGPLEVVSYDVRPANDEWLNDLGRLPEDLSEVSYDDDWSIQDD
jgi:hypothetical protein